MTHPTTWALVANVARARILPDPAGACQREIVAMARAPHLRAFLADRCAVEVPNDATMRRDLEDFAREIGMALETHRRAAGFERLAVLAVPPMLPVLRETMPEVLRCRVVLERGVDLVGLPEADLRALVIRMLAAV